MKNTDVSKFISDLDAGVFEEKLGAILSEVASSVVDQEKGGKVNIALSFKKINGSCQVIVEHKLSYSLPTKRGSRSEEDKTSTPLHVGVGGVLSFFPEAQVSMFDKPVAVKNAAEVSHVS